MNTTTTPAATFDEWLETPEGKRWLEESAEVAEMAAAAAHGVNLY